MENKLISHTKRINQIEIKPKYLQLKVFNNIIKMYISFNWTCNVYIIKSVRIIC